MRLLFIALTLALLGCAHVEPLPAGRLDGGGIPNLYCVSSSPGGTCEIYRSAQPNAGQFSFLVARYGIRSVVKLNAAWEGRDRLPGGVEPFEHPWAPLGPVDHDDVVAALEDLARAPRPVLIHCTHGVDRTGLLVALWRVLVEHALPMAAWNEWRAYGANVHWDALFDRAFERETGWKAAP